MIILLLITIIVTAVSVRFIRIDQSLWLDEAINAQAVLTHDWWYLVSQYPIGDFHPPLYHLILKAWTILFGHSETALRLPSVIFGTMTVVVVFLMGRKIFNSQVGLTAALLLSLSGLHIYYSQEVRMYALAALLACLSMFFFIGWYQQSRQASKSDKLWWWVSGYIISTVLLLYTDYLPYFLVVTQHIWVIANRHALTKHFWKMWYGSGLLITLLLAPLLPIFAKQLQTGLSAASDSPLWGEVVGGLTLKGLLLVPVKFMVGRISFDDKVVYGVIIFLAGWLFIAPIVRALFDWKKTSVVWWWLIGPLLLAAMVAVKIPIFSYFRFLFLLPAFYLLVAGGSWLLPKKVGGPILIFISFFTALSGWYYLHTPLLWRENWKDATAYIANQSGSWKSAAVFVTDYQFDPYVYYGAPIDYYGPTGWQNRGFRQLFLMRYVQPIFDPQDRLRQMVERQGFAKVEEKDFNGVTIWRYQGGKI